jgi:hypothetical protein
MGLELATMEVLDFRCHWCWHFCVPLMRNRVPEIRWNHDVRVTTFPGRRFLISKHDWKCCTEYPISTLDNYEITNEWITKFSTGQMSTLVLLQSAMTLRVEEVSVEAMWDCLSWLVNPKIVLCILGLRKGFMET